MKAAELFVKCLENEGVEYIFGIPGEENIDLMDALLDSNIRFITTRHEQGAAFMADVYGRLTGKPGVCLSTLGPGATNLITGFADANMDNAPIVGIAGQGTTARMHKESHQILDLVNLFKPISKYSIGLRTAEVIPEVVRKAFRDAASEKPGGSFIDLPENIAKAEVSDGLHPLLISTPDIMKASEAAIERAADLIAQAKFPVVLVGNGVIRSGACDALRMFAETLQIPVANTFMAKGSLSFSHKLSLGTIGLQAQDYVTCGLSYADVIICAGYDMVEYHPKLWNPDADKAIIHVAPIAAETDACYIPKCPVIGDIGTSLQSITQICNSKRDKQTCREKPEYANALRKLIAEDFTAYANDSGFPVKPQKIVCDLHQAVNSRDIVISDVGAHKMWMARMYQAEQPNTCLISNGFASMGIAVPGAIAAKLVHPDRNIVAVTGDAGFMMNSQEMETALRIGTPIVILIWKDNAYGLIAWHQLKEFGRTSHINFTNPDFVKYAESFGAKAYRVEAAADLLPIIKRALADETVVVIDCPVDYSMNMKFTEQMGNLVCPI